MINVLSCSTTAYTSVDLAVLMLLFHCLIIEWKRASSEKSMVINHQSWDMGNWVDFLLGLAHFPKRNTPPYDV